MRTRFALERIPVRLRSDVLADGRISETFGILTHSPIPILNNTVSRQELFARLQEAADDQAREPLLDLAGADLNASITLDEAGDGNVRIGSTSIRFPHAALLKSDPEARRKLVDRILGRHTLSAQHKSEFLVLVGSSTVSEKAFIHAVNLLSNTPEFFARLFEEKLNRAKGNISEDDLLPDHPDYWENLTARIEASRDLPTFIAAELAEERKQQMDTDTLRAYRNISLCFCASELVPTALFDELSTDAVVAALEDILRFDDPFALVGSFEYCARSIHRDSRFAVLGEKLLLRLFADMEGLRRATGMWASGFVIATARLALDDQTRKQPVYWRRLSAASHASLIVRTCGVHDIDPTGILGWAIRMRGLEYHCSILSDMAVEPRWRPEWADPGILAADIFSRAYGALHSMPAEAAPAAWVEHIGRGKSWVGKEKLDLFLTTPSVLQGGLSAAAPPIAEMEPSFAKIFQRFIAEPDLDNFFAAAATSQRFGVPSEIGSSLLEGLVRIRKAEANLDDPKIREILTLYAHLALLTSDVKLADVVLQTVLDSAGSISRMESVNAAAFRIIEASGAITEEAARHAFLRQGFLTLASILPASPLLEDLESVMNALTRVHPSLAASLGSARHTAQLGKPSAII